RAAGGPAEDTFSNLLGLELRPRRSRDAAALWTRMELDGGAPGRDTLWSHPDLLPEPDQLADWQGWLAARAGGASDMDRELEQMLRDAGFGADDTGAET